MNVRDFIEHVKAKFSSRQRAAGDQCIQLGQVKGNVHIFNLQISQPASCTLTQCSVYVAHEEDRK